ncbi:hypothetical protein O9K51_09117 [Purpureocillium lavendulum]|uniref:Uncharacterized protein n=1 Tax=Purpureocillium lavendulum TaxID=1247861 RepID=A0AB34FHK4_9HYPO|nr:hypothetical protein O9K51_09117 [Purpureocillium lavendulum]
MRCTTYSIGEAPDGSPIIWVSGKGGWYEINPAPRYRDIHRKMCEATTLYYALLDVYSERPPKKSKKSKQSLMDELSGVFFKYAVSIGDGSTLEEVIERCHEHAGFFIGKFQQDPFDWSVTPFYRWLTAEHAQPSGTEDESPFASILRAMELVYDEQAAKKKGLLASSVMSRLYFIYKFPNYRDSNKGSYKVPVQEVLHYYASDLLRNLDASRWQSHEIWSFLQELSQTEFKPVAYRMSELPVRMVPRKQMSRVPKQDHSQPTAPQPSRKRADDDEDSTPVPHGKGIKGRQKSSLRPISTKKRPRSQFETDSESEEVGAKKSHFFDEDDGMDDGMDDAMDDAELANTDNQGPVASNPEPIPIIIKAEKIPSTVPQGPQGTWTCDQDGCDYIVRGGDDYQARIQDHFRDHEQLDRVSLAMMESRGGQLPIKYALYAFFPPFIILVDLKPSPGPPQKRDVAVQTRWPLRSRSGSLAHLAPSPAAQSEVAPALSGPSGPPSIPPDVFSDYVRQFRRSPHPVADKMLTLTHLLDKIKRLGDKAQQHQASVTGLAVPQPIKRKLIVFKYLYNLASRTGTGNKNQDGGIRAVSSSSTIHAVRAGRVHPVLSLGRLQHERVLNGREPAVDPEPALAPAANGGLLAARAVAFFHELVLAAAGPAGEGVVGGAEQVLHGLDLGGARLLVGVGRDDELAHAAAHLGDRRGHELEDVRPPERRAALGAVDGRAGHERPVDDGERGEDRVVEQLLDDAQRHAGVRVPVVHDGRDDLRARGRGRRSGVNQPALGPVDAGQNVAERLGSDPAHGSHKYLSAGHDGVQSSLGSLGLDAVNERLEFFVGCLASEQCANLLALGGEGVHDLAFRLGQLEELGKDGVDCHVLGLPRVAAVREIAQLVKGSRAFDKGAIGEVTVEIRQVSSHGVPVEVEDVDGINEPVSNERRGKGRRSRHRLDILLGVDREPNLREERTGAGNHRSRYSDGGQGVLGRVGDLVLGLDILKRQLPRTG